MCVMKVLITGGAGYLGQQIAESLSEIADVIVLDIRQPFRTGRWKFINMDVRSGELKDVIKKEGVSAVIHLAFVLNPPENRQSARSINVEGTRNVLSSVKEGGAEWFLVTSSTTAYGARPEHIEPCTEDSPLYAWIHRGAWYTEDKITQEILVSNFKVNNPHIRVTVVRPPIVAGKNMKNYITELIFGMPIMGKIGGCNPPYQFIHEKDVARAFRFIIENKLEGIYNLVAQGTLTLEDMARLTGRRCIYFPKWLTPLFVLIARKHTGYPVPASMVDYFTYPWLADGSKLYSTGFKPEHTAEETFLEAWEVYRASKNRK